MDLEAYIQQVIEIVAFETPIKATEISVNLTTMQQYYFDGLSPLEAFVKEFEGVINNQMKD